ncbi:MAG: hypothetical protein AB1351_09960 [Thermoproteota archaeon]
MPTSGIIVFSNKVKCPFIMYSKWQMFIGPSGISGYAPWATWTDILIVVGGVAAAIAVTVLISNYRKKKTADSHL